MNLSQLKSQLQASIPEELYKIEPGQITYFVSSNGVGAQDAFQIVTLVDSLSVLKKEAVKIQITATNNEILIGKLVGRNNKTPYNVVIGTESTIGGFASEYFDGDIQVDSSIESEQPILVSINPDDCPSKQQPNVPDCSLCPYVGEEGFDGMQAMVEEKNKPSLLVLENKISAVLADCERYGYDVDTIGLKDKVREAWEHPIEYELELDIQEKQWLGTNGRERNISVCDIYIKGNGEKHIINLRPAEKALYLTNILRGGFPLANMSMDVINDMSSIFQQIPGHQTKEDGLVYKNQSISGIGVMKKRIRDAFAIAINFGPDVENLAMEGFRKKEVSIRKATDEHREQIKKYFGL